MNEDELPPEEIVEIDTDVMADFTAGLEEEEPLPDGHKSGFVAVVGAPNAGKSTLINSLLKQKIAIVSPRPQTTRTRQLGILTEPDHQIVFIDTPGLIKKAMHPLDEIMVETVMETLDGADMIVWLIDLTRQPNAIDRELGNLLKPLSKNLPVILAMNKLDQLKVSEVLQKSGAYQRLLPDVQWLAFSAQTTAGLSELHDMILAALPEGPRFYPKDQITDSFIRTIAGEMVREQILLQLKDELPHAIAVAVDEFKERENGQVFIHGTIYVERETHKKIVIGHEGRQIKRIGESARRQIEQLIDTKAFLELHVKVAPKWRRDRKLIERFGYSKG